MALASPTKLKAPTYQSQNFRSQELNETLLRSLTEELKPYEGILAKLEPIPEEIAQFFLSPVGSHPVVAFAQTAQEGDFFHVRDHFRFWKEVERKLQHVGIAKGTKSRELAWELLRTPQGRLSMEKRALFAEMSRTKQNRIENATLEELIHLSNYPETAAITAAANLILKGDKSLKGFAQFQMDTLITRTKEKYHLAKKYYSKEFNRLNQEEKRFALEYQERVVPEGNWLFEMKEPLTEQQKGHIRLLKFIQNKQGFEDYIPTAELAHYPLEVQEAVKKLFNERFQALKPVKAPELLYP
jgi:hypothetical protein